MSAHLLLAPVGAGKTEAVLAQLQAQIQQKNFARIWVLLATQRQEVALRERLFATGDKNIFFNVEFFDFYKLFQRLLDMAGNPQRLISPQGRMLLLRHITQQTKPDLAVFGEIAHTLGFPRILGNWISELKQNLVQPEAYTDAISTPRDQDLARLYRAYQDALITHYLMDREGQGWLALEALQDDATLVKNAQIDMLIVDGFDQFSHTQTALLAYLARQVPSVYITLTQVTGRESTIGRRFETAKAELSRAFNTVNYPLTVLTITQREADKHPDLHHLAHHIFMRATAKKPVTGGINFIEAPTPADEIASVLRQVKALLHKNVPPEAIMIAVRDWMPYRKHILHYGEKYGLPLAIHDDEPLIETPFVMILMHILAIHTTKFPRRMVLDALRSPYLNNGDFSSDELTALDIISQQKIILHGRETWLGAIADSVTVSPEDAEDEEAQTLSLSQADAEMLMSKLATFFDRITPPPTATLREYATWLETLIGTDPLTDTDDEEDAPIPLSDSLNIIRTLRLADARWLWRDLQVIQAVKHCLSELLTAQAQLYGVLGDAIETRLTWDDFYAQLVNALTAGRVSPRPNRLGRVLVTQTSDARGLPHAHLFIIGLSDGIFPASIPQDPLYLESERITLNMALPNNPIKTQMDMRDEEGVFYELICLPYQSLTLSRPTLKDGKEWLPSPLWRGAMGVFDAVAIQKIGVGKTMDIAHAATPDEAITALAVALNTAQPSAETLGMGAWLVNTYPTAWARVHHNRTIEQGRIAHYHNRHNGIIQHTGLRDYITQLLGTDYTWSATRLNDQGLCGFRFFAKYMLRLSALQEPQAGMDVLQRGNLLHGILEVVYRELANRDIEIIPDNIQIAYDLLDNIAPRLLASAPHDYGFRPTSLWEKEKATIIQKLRQFITTDFDNPADHPMSKLGVHGTRKPYRLEAGFGFGDSPFTLHLGDEVGDIRVRGKIDRMDIIGDAVVVMDYKSGSTAIPIDEIAGGRNYQMLIYLHAAEHLIKKRGLHVAGGFFWHLANVSAKGMVNPSDHADKLNEGMINLKNQIGASREGNFSVNPNKPHANGLCTRYCEFGKLCRHYRGSSDEDESE